MTSLFPQPSTCSHKGIPMREESEPETICARWIRNLLGQKREYRLSKSYKPVINAPLPKSEYEMPIGEAVCDDPATNFWYIPKQQ